MPKAKKITQTIAMIIADDVIQKVRTANNLRESTLADEVKKEKVYKQIVALNKKIDVLRTQMTSNMDLLGDKYGCNLQHNSQRTLEDPFEVRVRRNFFNRYDIQNKVLLKTIFTPSDVDKITNELSEELISTPCNNRNNY